MSVIHLSLSEPWLLSRDLKPHIFLWFVQRWSTASKGRRLRLLHHLVFCVYIFGTDSFFCNQFRKNQIFFYIKLTRFRSTLDFCILSLIQVKKTQTSATKQLDSPGLRQKVEEAYLQATSLAPFKANLNYVPLHSTPPPLAPLSHPLPPFIDFTALLVTSPILMLGTQTFMMMIMLMMATNLDEMLSLWILDLTL